jgi:hypothetical protein
MFHCPPSQLEKEDASIMRTFTILALGMPAPQEDFYGQ